MKRIVPIVIAVILGIAPETLAVTANSVVTAQTPNRGTATFTLTANCTSAGVPASCCTGSGAGCTAGTYYPIYTAAASGSKCNGLWLNSTDTATHVVTIQITNAGGTVLYTGPQPITTTAAGGAGTPTLPQNVLAAANWPGLPLDSDSNPFFQMVTGDLLQAKWATAITTATQLNLYAICYDF